MEGTLGSWGGAQAAGWSACSCHSAPWSWLTAAAAAAAGGCWCWPVTVTSMQIAGTNPHPGGSPTGRPAGGGTPGPAHHSPRSRWRLPLPLPAPGRTSSHRRASRSCRSMLSSAFLREVAASSCAPVLAESNCRKTIWHRVSRDCISPTVPCNLT